MQYFKNQATNEVFAYDENQGNLIQDAINNGFEEITGNWPLPVEPSPPTSQELLDAIKVTTQSGKVFDGDELSQTRIARSLQIGQFTGQTSTAWKLADNAVQEVTYVELQEALTLAMIEVGRIVGAIE